MVGAGRGRRRQHAGEVAAGTHPVHDPDRERLERRHGAAQREQVVDPVEPDHAAAHAVGRLDRAVAAGRDPVPSVGAEVVPLIDLAGALDEAAGVDVVKPGEVLAEKARVPAQVAALLDIGLKLIALDRAQLARIKADLVQVDGAEAERGALVVTGAEDDRRRRAERRRGRAVPGDAVEVAQLDVDAIIVEGHDGVLNLGRIDAPDHHLIGLYRPAEHLDAPVRGLLVLQGEELLVIGSGSRGSGHDPAKIDRGADAINHEQGEPRRQVGRRADEQRIVRAIEAQEPDGPPDPPPGSAAAWRSAAPRDCRCRSGRARCRCHRARWSRRTRTRGRAGAAARTPAWRRGDLLG